jgi:hypothetical protein
MKLNSARERGKQLQQRREKQQKGKTKQQNDNRA